MKTNADNIKEQKMAAAKDDDVAEPKKRRLRKKKTDRTICRETLAMTMFQKAMEALEAMDATSLSATNVVHLLEIAAKLEKLSEDNNEKKNEAEPTDYVKIYLPDNGRQS